MLVVVLVRAVAAAVLDGLDERESSNGISLSVCHGVPSGRSDRDIVGGRCVPRSVLGGQMGGQLGIDRCVPGASAELGEENGPPFGPHLKREYPKHREASRYEIGDYLMLKQRVN